MREKSILKFCVAAAIALIVALSGSFSGAVQADIGVPPVSPSGSSVAVEPGFETSVRMVAERVDMTIEEHRRVPSIPDDAPAYWMRALVRAEFQMRNLGEEEERFNVWFPLSSSVRYPRLLEYEPENVLQDFQVWVDGQPVAVEQVSAPEVADPERMSPWATFPVIFPPGEDVIVTVSYTLYPSGRRPFGGFEYILQTGAGWKDTIGEALITISLPDPVTEENVSLSGKSIEGNPIAPQPDGYTVEGNTIRWELRDFEPTAADNIYIDVLEPGRYHALLAARDRVAREPNSVDAQLELAEAVQNAVMVIKMVGQHGGGEELAAQANAAYRRALELDPGRAQTYLRYADWLLATGGWRSLMADGACPQELCDLVQSGLQVAPNNAELSELDRRIREMQAEAAPYATQNALSRTATAAAYPRIATIQALETASARASLTPRATDSARMTPTVPAPSATPASSAAGTAKTPGGLWLAAGLPLLVVAALALVGRRLWAAKSRN